MPTTLLADILLLTATKVESQAVLAAFEAETRQKARPQLIDSRTYFDLGVVNGWRVFLTMCEMGAGGLGAAQQAVRQGIEALSPRAVIMAGIAFGANPARQEMGDILLAENLRCYEPQRVGEKVIPRGDRPHCSDWLLNLLKSADLLWTGARVHSGLVLTGEKLVDNPVLLRELLALEPEAIGGEMEGAGLYAACQEKKVDWILVKAICDWADGHKEEDRAARQQAAAANAVALVLHALRFAAHANSGAAAEATVQSSLPTQPYFFGRQKELASIAEAILPEARTWGVLIDGPGGIGKTALAVRAAYFAPAVHYSRKIFLSAKVRELTPAGEQPLEDFMLPNYLTLLTELARELGDPNLPRLPENERANAARRALEGQRALLVIDNLETFAEQEQIRLYQFLGHLPAGCKAIVTSRRRSDVDARVIRLDRLELNDAMELLAKLAENNRHLAAASALDWQRLYEFTGGNPLLLRWTAGQLGRRGGQCYTVDDACAYLRNAPPGNDPLEFIFGDLVDTFTESETLVLAALAHFTQPAEVKWIADIAGLAERQAETALEDLSSRALVESDPAGRTFLLPPLAARFLRAKRPEVVARTGGRLVDRTYALALENGYRQFERFHVLESEWPALAAALPRFLDGDSALLQELCVALADFLDFSGRWDERLRLSQEAERKAAAANDHKNAGWRAYESGWVHYLRGQATEVLAYADRAQAHWKADADSGGAREQATGMGLRGVGLQLKGDKPAAAMAYREALEVWNTIAPESEDVATVLNYLAELEMEDGDYAAAERSFRKALHIANKAESGGREGVAIYTGNLAALALARDDWPAAEELAREALALAEEVGRQELIGSDCQRLARAIARQGRPAEGIRYARRAVEIFTKLRQTEWLEIAHATLKECEPSA